MSAGEDGIGMTDDTGNSILRGICDDADHDWRIYPRTDEGLTIVCVICDLHAHIPINMRKAATWPKWTGAIPERSTDGICRVCKERHGV